MVESGKDLGPLKALDDLARYEKLLEIYRSPEGAERIEKELRSDDPLLKLLILNFLQEVAERQAVRLLLTLLEDSNEIVREAAARSYARNRYPRKANHLRRYVMSRSPWAARFAIKTLAALRDQQALPLILSLLPRAERAARLEMIKALRYLPQPRVVPVLTALSGTKDEETRYHAIKTLAVLPFSGTKVRADIFLKAARDSSPRVRRLALSTLGSYSSKNIARFIQERAFSSASEDRFWAIEALSSFPAVEWIDPLVRIMALEPQARLRLAAELSLKRFPADLLRGGLRYLLDDPLPSIRRQSAQLMAELFGEERETRRKLLEMWSQVTDLQEKLEWLAVLRELGGDEVFHILYGVITQSTLLAYTSASIMNRMAIPGHDLRVLTLLREKLSKPVRQALLSGVVRRGPDQITHGEYFKVFVSGLSDPVSTFRYGCLQGLAWYPLGDILEPVLDLLSRETDDHVRRMADRLLAKGLGLDPAPLLECLRQVPFSDKLMVWLLSFLKDHSWSSTAACAALRLLDKEPLSLRQSRPGDYYALAVAWMEKGCLGFDEIWPIIEEDAERGRFLEFVRGAMAQSAGRFPPLPVDFLVRELRDRGPDFRGWLYALLGANQRPEGIPHLAGCMVREKDPALLRAGQAQLKNLFWEKPA